ncbi:MAG: glycosyltransferase family 4 protein [Deltaproteobacteria bacterium]|nr:glycosyltransferase family 4 protein [Deltaproteobacteria bacterium]
MRVLVITKIFPNAREPLSCPFNRQQFAALSRLCDVEVLATIPWFPMAAAFGRWSAAGRLIDVPWHDVIDGVRVRHPRYLLVPKIGHSIAGYLYAGSLLPVVARYRGRVDVILGAWAYPDGYASVLLAKLLGVPAVVKLHGSDVNVVARLRGPRKHLERVLPLAHRVVAVSKALKESAIELGVEADRIDLVRNGVDGEIFHVRDRAQARAGFGLPKDGRVILYVGTLSRPKGAMDAISAFEQATRHDDDVRLVLVGDGPGRGECEAAAARLGDRVLVVGARPQREVALWMAACDVLTLPSWNEGTPNVILEALACGRRVVATRVGGIPDVLSTPLLGELVPPRDVDGLAGAFLRAARAPYDPKEIAALGARGDWEESAAKLRDSLQKALE